MASSFFTAHTFQIASGTPRYTSPAPERTAERAQRFGAPVYPTLPPTMRSFP